MFSKIYGIGLYGVEAYLVDVEVDIRDGLPCFSMVGALAPEVKEAQDRVKTALKNSGFLFQPKKVTVNLSPADVKKTGTGFDLPIAAGILGACQFLRWEKLEQAVFIGEVSLDGEVKPVRGILPMVMEAKRRGKNICYLPTENEREGRLIPGIQVVGLSHIRQLTALPEKEIRESQGTQVEEAEGTKAEEPERYDFDYREVQGQYLMKRATEVAVAGRHNILYIGAAGSGKTMIAERIPTIMPSCTREEKLEISKIYSICGLLPKEKPFMSRRPFRSPHHSATAQALTGGGKNPLPGEMSLASGGVLFLDELPEFSRHAIEMLRQPLESRKIVLSRVNGRYEFPADFILAAAMNPCPCGFYPDRNRCHCNDAQIQSYMGKVSKPILDRIDICVESSPVAYEELKGGRGQESSKEIRKRVERVRAFQKKRFQKDGISYNSEMTQGMLQKYCRLEEAEDRFFRSLYRERGFSARAYSKILKVARTIADLEESDKIMHKHLCEAIGYRSLEDKYWSRIM